MTNVLPSSDPPQARRARFALSAPGYFERLDVGVTRRYAEVYADHLAGGAEPPSDWPVGQEMATSIRAALQVLWEECGR